MLSHADRSPELPMRRRSLTAADREVWAGFVRYVARLPNAAPVEPPLPADLPGIVAPPLPGPPPLPARPTPRKLVPLEIGSSPGGIDRNTWARLHGGKLAPERTLDLHGRTVQRAHADLHAFLAAAHAERLRCVEVITGRGSGETGGVLRREVPLWLNGPALRPIVLAASHPHPANKGAIRILLRRVR